VRARKPAPSWLPPWSANLFTIGWIGSEVESVCSVATARLWS
jgi:hypothetical protein